MRIFGQVAERFGPLPSAHSWRTWCDAEFRVLGNDGSELLGKCVTVNREITGKSKHSCSRHNYSSGSAEPEPEWWVKERQDGGVGYAVQPAVNGGSSC